MNLVLNHYFARLINHAQFHAIRARAPFHPLGRVILYGNHGLHRLANHIPNTPLNDLTAEQMLHLWLTAEYVRLSDPACTSHTLDIYGLIDLWPTILHERKPTLTTDIAIINYVKTSIIQHYPQFTYDDAILTTIAEAVVTIFHQRYMHLALYIVPKSRQPIPPPPRRTRSYWTPPPPKPVVRPFDPEDEYFDPEIGHYEPEPRTSWFDTDPYWGLSAEENALCEQEYQEAMERDQIEQDKIEFDEIERQTRYNDTDRWENPHGDYD